MRIENKTIVLTGGTSGIGYELVKQLHSNNEILVIGRDQEKLDELQKQFNSIKYSLVDLSELEELEKTCKLIASHYPKIDLLVCNAAQQFEVPFLHPDFESRNISREIDVNLSSNCILVAELLPCLHDTKGGREAAILFVGSALGIVPKTSSAVYCATKAAIRSVAWSLRYQLADTNVKVLQSYLPLVDTPMTLGRGSGKISAETAAQKLVHGIANNTNENYIGKAKLISLIHSLLPSLARRIMKKY